MEDIERLDPIILIRQETDNFLALIFHNALHVLPIGDGIFGVVQFARKTDGLLLVVGLKEIHVAALQQIVHALLTFGKSVGCRMEMVVVGLLAEVQLALGRDVEGRDGVVGQFAIVVEHGLQADLNVLVDVQLRIVHVLAGMEDFVAVGVEVVDNDVSVLQARFPEIFSARFIVDFAQLYHLRIGIDEAPVLVVERHGDEQAVEHHDILINQLLFAVLFFLYGREVLHGGDNLRRAFARGDFGHGIAMHIEPEGMVGRAEVPAVHQVEGALVAV